MLMTNGNYFKNLIKYKDNHVDKSLDYSDYINDYVLNNNTYSVVIKDLYESGANIKTIDFYMFLLKKLHKIISELLRDDSKSACDCIKTITSLITQATITLEKQFNDIEEANEFIECVGLKELSNALFIYFSTGDISEIENQLLRVKDDIIWVRDCLMSANN